MVGWQFRMSLLYFSYFIKSTFVVPLFAMFYLCSENTSANKINPIDLAGKDIEDIFCGKVAQLLVVRRSDMPQFNIGTDPRPLLRGALVQVVKATSSQLTKSNKARWTSLRMKRSKLFPENCSLIYYQHLFIKFKDNLKLPKNHIYFPGAARVVQEHRHWRKREPQPLWSNPLPQGGKENKNVINSTILLFLKMLFTNQNIFLSRSALIFPRTMLRRFSPTLTRQGTRL